MSSTEPRGFSFPGTFDICAMGAADAALDALVPELLGAAGLTVEPGSLSTRPSRAGRYVAVRLRFRAEDRAAYEAAHAALRAHPAIQWTL